LYVKQQALHNLQVLFIMAYI